MFNSRIENTIKNKHGGRKSVKESLSHDKKKNCAYSSHEIINIPGRKTSKKINRRYRLSLSIDPIIRRRIIASRNFVPARYRFFGTMSRRKVAVWDSVRRPVFARYEIDSPRCVSIHPARIVYPRRHRG